VIKKIFIILILVYSISFSKPEKPDYYPLHIGDKWIYEHTELPPNVTTRFNTIEIIDTTTINYKLYFLCQEQIGSFWGYDPYGYGYFHKDSLNQLWFVNYYTKKERKSIDFNRTPGLVSTYFDSVNNMTTKNALLDTNDLQITPAGIFYDCYHFWSETVEIYTDYHSWYAPNIGFVHSLAEGEELVLYGACINGVVYGDTNISVPSQIMQSGIQQVNDFTLDQNYPNPFNSDTEIRYTLQQKGNVQLIIYNLQGQPVRTLVTGYCQSGEYTTRWNGCDDTGAPLSSGIYFYRLTIDGQAAATKRLVMVK